MVDVFEKVRKLDKPAEFHKVEKNVMLVKFMSSEDIERVMDGGPWSLDGNGILLQRWESGMTEMISIIQKLTCERIYTNCHMNLGLTSMLRS